MGTPTLLAVVCLVAICSARYTIRPLGYLRLPASVNPDTYKILSGSAEEAGYDSTDQLLYVVGEGSKLLHVVDLSDPMNPRRVLTHEFHAQDGTPRDVEACNGEVVVALSAEIPVFPGHVNFYQSYKHGADHIVYDRKVTVGEFPDNLKYVPGCKQLVVVNEGKPGLDYAGRWLDPEGSLTIITKSQTGNPSERFVDFNSFNNRHDIRSIAKSIPANVLVDRSTVAQEMEPEYVAIPDANNAYVTFQENNLIAQVNLRDGTITNLIQMGPKDFTNAGIDASDRDGGIHMRKYPLKALRNPDVIKSVVFNRRAYFFVADEGARKTYTQAQHGLQWDEGERARVLHYQNEYDTSTSGITNTSFLNNLNDDGALGRLYVSKIDGINPFGGKIEEVFAFGGRGFSIWDSGTRSMLYDSGDELERRAKDSYYNVFNTDAVQPTVYSPETLKDTVSDDMGPKPNALDAILDNGEVFLVVGSETTGIIYLYNVTLGTTPAATKVDFQDIYRRGKTDSLYEQLYENNEAGDMGIGDIGLIPAANSPTNRTMFYVLGSASGSVSLYEIENLGPDFPTNP